MVRPNLEGFDFNSTCLIQAECPDRYTCIDPATGMPHLAPEMECGCFRLFGYRGEDCQEDYWWTGPFAIIHGGCFFFSLCCL